MNWGFLYLGESISTVVHDGAGVIAGTQVVDFGQAVLEKVVLHSTHYVLPVNHHMVVPVRSRLLVPET